MTGTTSLVKGYSTGYNKVEKKFIFDEFKSLMAVRQDKYLDDTLKEWVKCFWDAGYTANQVCKRIKAVKEMKVYSKVTFSDFINAEIEEIPDIIPPEVKAENYYVIFTCKVCGKSTTAQKKDLYTLKQIKICNHKIMDEFNIKSYSTSVNEDYQEFEI